MDIVFMHERRKSSGCAGAGSCPKDSGGEGDNYLLDGYPAGDNDGWRQIRAASAQKRKAEWDVFIQYLRNNRKIAE
jgi:hypothetical protein